MANTDIIRVGNLNIDTASYRLHKDETPVKLTPTEWALLKELVQHPNQVLTHRVLLRRVWGDEYSTENDYVHTYISRLRRKLEDSPANPQYILTEAGLGYRFDYEAPSEPPASEAAPVEEPPTVDTSPEPPRPAYINPLPQHLDGRYVGRQAQREQLRDLLLDSTRLVSIYGRAGVGKTALASTVLDELQQSEAFSGMVLLSANSTGITLGRILSDFERLLGTAPDETPEQRQTLYRVTNLLDRLRAGNYVLLLDNLEHLQDPETGRLTDGDMETLLKVALEQGSTLRILVTSRYPLNLPHAVKMWERVIALEDGLTVEDGITLLRTSDPDGYAGLRDEDESILAQIVERTHALPRALEAVTGILLESPLLTPGDLLDDEAMLDDEVGELFIGEAIARLDPESVRVMELVSLFDRAVPLDMLGQFAQPNLEGEALKPILNRLVRAYFLKFSVEDRTIAMHPIDRDYCYNRIAPDERRTLHAQLADLYADRTNLDADGMRSIADLTAPLSTVAHRVQAGEYDRAAELLVELDRRFMHIWGNDTELAALYAQVIRFIADDDLLRTVTLRYGEALRRVGHLPEAIAHFERARTLASEHEDGQDMANALNSMGWAHYDTGQFTEAIAYWENALNIYRETGNRSGEGDTLSGMGWVSYLMGSYEQALNYVQDALRIFGEIGGHLHRVGMNIGDSGVIRAAQGHYGTAIQNLRESLSIAAMNNSLNERSYKGGYLAMVLLLAGSAEEAESVARTALQYDVPANRHFVAAVHGLALATLGRGDEAERAFEQAVRYADALLKYSAGLYNARYARALALTGLAVMRGDPADEAVAEYDRALALCGTDGVRQVQAGLVSVLDGDAVERVQAVLHT